MKPFANRYIYWLAVEQCLALNTKPKKQQRYVAQARKTQTHLQNKNADQNRVEWGVGGARERNKRLKHNMQNKIASGAGEGGFTPVRIEERTEDRVGSLPPGSKVLSRFWMTTKLFLLPPDTS